MPSRVAGKRCDREKAATTETPVLTGPHPPMKPNRRTDMATEQRPTNVPEHISCQDEEPGDMFAGPDPHSVAWALEEEERRNAEHERMLRQDEDTLRFEHEQRDDPPSTMDSEHNDWHAEHGNNGPCPYDCAACDPDNWYSDPTGQVLCGHCGYYESIDGVRNCAKMHHRSASILDDLIATDRNPVETQEFKRLAALIRTPASLRTEPLGGMRNPLFTHEEAFIDWAARTSHGDNPR